MSDDDAVYKPFSTPLPHKIEFDSEKEDKEALLISKELGERAVFSIAGKPVDTRAEIERFLYGESFGEASDDFARRMARDLSKLGRYSVYSARGLYTRTVGYAIPFREAIERIAKEGTPILEVGAGSGVWSAILEANGVDVIATDSKEWKWKPEFFPVARRRAVPAIRENHERDVLLIWPSLGGRWTEAALRNIQPGRTLFLIAEGSGGCCATDEFFGLLASRFDLLEEIAIPQWPGIRDYFEVWRKR
jgi:hypothetical protein